ncbi:MAG: 8-amino-7-oxononanoate synthase [Polyangiaceae bacterium]
MTTRADPLRHLAAELRDLEERSLLRTPPPPRPRLHDTGAPEDAAREEPPVLLCSNDYLGYAAAPWPDPLVSEASVLAATGADSMSTDETPPPMGGSAPPMGGSALPRGGSALPRGGSAPPMGSGTPPKGSTSPRRSGVEMTGAGASRLVAGEHIAHVEVERELASWLGVESALLFSSGYAANVGTLAAVARRGDVILSDALNHASIIDGARLSGAEIIVVPHRDIAAMERALERISATRTTPGAPPNLHSSAATTPTSGRPSSPGPRAVWVVTESYFSMDGDIPDLRALRTLCDAHDAALYVDEAHALGVFGPRGRGLCAEAGVRPDVFVGTFGKALGLQGAFVAGSETLRRYLWNRARSFVFSTGISPALSACLLRNIRRAIADDASRERLHRIAARLREAMRAAGISMPTDARGPVLPWLVGPAAGALALSARLLEAGILVQAIRPPTVPSNTARLRITATANLTDREVERAAEAIQRVAVAWRSDRGPTP